MADEEPDEEHNSDDGTDEQSQKLALFQVYNVYIIYCNTQTLFCRK